MENDLSLIYGRYFEQVSQAFNAIRDDFRGDDSAGSTDSSDFPSQVRDFFNSLIQSQLEPEPQPQPQPEPMPGYGYGYDYGYYGGGEVVVETKPRICTKDMFRCPDGSLVSRDENCNFRPCPEPQQSPRIYRRGIPGFLIPTPNGGTEWVPEFGYGWNKYGVWAPKLTENSFLDEDYGYGGEEVVVEMQPQYEPKVAKLQFITAPTSDPVGDEYRAKLKFVNMYMNPLKDIAGSGLEGLGVGFSLGGRGGFQWRSTIILQTPEQEKRLFDLVQQASTDPDFGLKVVVSFLPLSSEPSPM